MVPRDGGLTVLARVEIRDSGDGTWAPLISPVLQPAELCPGPGRFHKPADRETQSRTCRFMSWAEQRSLIGVLSPLEGLTLTVIVREKWGGPTKLSHRGGAPSVQLIAPRWGGTGISYWPRGPAMVPPHSLLPSLSSSDP